MSVTGVVLVGSGARLDLQTVLELIVELRQVYVTFEIPCRYIVESTDRTISYSGITEARLTDRTTS